MRKLARSREKRLSTKGKHIWESVKITEKAKVSKRKVRRGFDGACEVLWEKRISKQERKKAGKHVSGQHQRAPAWLTGRRPWGCWVCCKRKVLPTVSAIGGAELTLSCSTQISASREAGAQQHRLQWERYFCHCYPWCKGDPRAAFPLCTRIAAAPPGSLKGGCCSGKGISCTSGSYFMHNFAFLYVLDWISKDTLFFDITRTICLSISHSGWDTFMGRVLNIYTPGSDSRNK